MPDRTKTYDVLVAGGGNAALCAAITARQAGATVLLVESAPKAFRGGNSRHTRNLRAMHEGPNGVLTDTYSEEEYWDDLLRVTGGQTDEHLARMTIKASSGVFGWMQACGVRFQPSLTGTLNLGRTNAFFLGGGKALVNAYYLTAERLGVEILYDSEVVSINMEDGFARSIDIRYKGFPETIHARCVVASSGGFQANLDWMRQNWGDAVDNFVIRGTPYNQGKVLKSLLGQGVAQIGDPTQCHAVALDARAPKFDGGITTRLDSVPFSVVVNKNGDRFYDEGEDVWPKRYAIWGRLIAQQPDQIAYSICDSKAFPLFMPSVFPAIKADSIEELAVKMKLDPAKIRQTIDGYNSAIPAGQVFDNLKLDGNHTEGLTPNKTNWARSVDKPPFYGYPLRPGITFTYLGVRVNEKAQVLMDNGQPAGNLFASGEIMSGNILGKGYLAGFGMAIGTVFGRIAGQEAANRARN
ncbi:MAG TPA: FAD-dependent tricarballylate dehydrogenase TcuA [Rhodopila sp.]|uniref:FAD-dependent tricarballylate dehydrogenase TcuA n=1 Tax=Rhodopila sp. TaxID=2480087 RepID=UPI002CE8F374|nr:FAD-dependent tricarballylate dehydrogenase TcuA [Rhodopila sp.]HVY14639.1 FAD-dependent tricarballylate dehydrogenase TcuA [Rhodopila sp.]